jgi:acyl-CoA synthetase (NDP forming)
VVNRRGVAVAGREAWTSLEDLPEVPDLVVVAVNSAGSVSVVAQAAGMGVRGVVLLASGFSETGEQGARLSDDVLAARGAMSLVGPNCLGFLDLTTGLAAYSGPMVEPAVPGNVALVSNSGAMACTLSGAAAERRIHFSHLVTTGNQLDLTIADFVRFVASSPVVRVIACYVEGFNDGRALLDAFDTARANGKTVVLLKGGRSKTGGEAARTHTGAIAGSASVQADLFGQYGVLLADDPDEFLTLIELGSRLDRPLRAPRIGAVTISGGERLLFADAAEEAGLVFAPLANETVRAVSAALPPFATASNPLDTTGAGIVDGDREAHLAAVLAVAADPSVDLLVACQDAKNGWVEAAQECQLFLDAVLCAAEAAVKTGTPVVVVSSTTGSVDRRAREELALRGIPCLMGLGQSMRALAKFTRVSAFDPRLRVLPGARAENTGSRLDVRSVIKRLALHGLDHWPTRFVRDAREAVDAAEELGYPVVLKLESGLAHRRAVGGVRMGLFDAHAVSSAWLELTQAAVAVGVAYTEMSIQPTAVAEVELFVGALKDEQFGPIVLLGRGGTDVESSDAFVVGLAPVSDDQAAEMVHRLPRGLVPDNDPVVIAALTRVLSAVSEIVGEPDVRAVDVNPLLILADRTVAIIDAKMVVDDLRG